MDRNEFVSTLRAVLTGEVPGAVLEDNVRYYEGYISQEIAGGKSEREVMEALGDPRLIAKTIIDTYQDAYQGRAEEVRTEYDQETGKSPEYHHVNMNTWYGRLLTFVIIILILMLVFTFISWLLPILLPVILIVWVIRILSQR